jgi:hypothetical protein
MLRSDYTLFGTHSSGSNKSTSLAIVPPELALKCYTMCISVQRSIADVHRAKLRWSKSRRVIAKAKLTTSHIIDCCHILFPRVRLRHKPILQLLTVALTTVICEVAVLKHVGWTWR